MRVLVCGSRTFNNEAVMRQVLAGIFEVGTLGYMTLDLEPFTLIHGDAKGADRMAEAIIRVGGLFGPILTERPEPQDAPDYPYCMVERYPADWDQHGGAAGPIRNRLMLDTGKPDEVWAFVDKPLAESRGTAHMVQIARKAGVPTTVIQADPIPEVKYKAKAIPVPELKE